MDRPAQPRQARWPRWREAVDRIVEDKAEVRNRFLCRMLSGSISGHPFTAKLDRTGALYTGKTRVRLFPADRVSSSMYKVRGAHADNRTWTASSWTGALVMSNRFTSSGNLFCPASSQTAALSGSP